MPVKKVSVEAICLDDAGFTGIRVHTEIDGYTSQAEKEAILHNVNARCSIFNYANRFTPVKFDVE